MSNEITLEQHKTYLTLNIFFYKICSYFFLNGKEVMKVYKYELRFKKNDREFLNNIKE